MANYLPVLLVSVTTNAIPDDSAVSTLPRGQVDYLSHDWQEEDVWRSWRNMTRQKNEIANGMRLENASWRTWWKQRNKLKTVTPETLNWLKDSDVTWLYGPLHTAVDWTPPPKPPPIATSVDKATSATDSLDLQIGAKKPILKHRSICELLTSDLPSPLFSPPDSDEEADENEEDVSTRENFHAVHEDMDERNRTVSANAGPPNRPLLLHTKSDTHITRWGPHRAFRKDSPPRIIAADAAPEVSLPRGRGAASDVDITPGAIVATNSTGGSKKKHISFNTFVEQCIAIEKPKKPEDSGFASVYQGKTVPEYDDGYDEDSEGGYMEEDSDLTLFPEDRPPSDNTDSDEDDDDVLEMKTPSTTRRVRPSPGRSSSSSTSSSSASGYSSRNSDRSQIHLARRNSSSLHPPLARTPSVDKGHVTIAPIAPTMLKTTGVGNGTGHGYDEDDEAGCGAYQGQGYNSGFGVGKGRGGDGTPVELVYVPPLGSNYSIGPRRGSGSLDTRSGEEDEAGIERSEDVYHHRESYFSIGTGSTSPPPADTEPARVYFTQPLVHSSPMQVNGVGEDAYDYFSGPDLGEDFGRRRVPQRSYSGGKLGVGRGSKGDVMVDDANGQGDGVVLYRTGRGRAPEVVVNGGNKGDTERSSRSRSRSQSRSRTPSPAELSSPQSASTATVPIPTPTPTVTIPHGGSARSHPSSASSLLSPPDTHLSRGRSSAEPRGRSSSSPASADRGRASNEPRGRSATRNSSFSDRERSSSRGGTSSPLGSISPEGSGVGIGSGHGGSGVYGANPQARRRGREGSSRSISESLSPDDTRRPATSAAPEPSSSSISPSSSSSSLSRSTSTTSSTSTMKPPRLALGLGPDDTNLETARAPSIPTPIAEETEEEQQRSRQPTPANSPVMGFRTISIPPSPPPAPSPVNLPSHSSAKGIMSRSPPSSPTGARDGGIVRLGPDRMERDGTLVSRAVEIVSSAGAFLGSMWH